MKAIKDQIKKESCKDKPDYYVLENLNRILDNGMITFSEWKDSGRFMNVNTFMELYPKEKIHKDCIDVVHYFGGMYIQALKTNKFFIEPKTYGKSLDAMEELVWKERAEKLFKKT
jgi:hypothetical protein